MHTKVSHGVPQGSMLGQILFNVCTLPLGNVFRKQHIHFCCYADDILVYLSKKTDEANQAVKLQEHHVKHVKKYNTISLQSPFQTVKQEICNEVPITHRVYPLQFDRWSLLHLRRSFPIDRFLNSNFFQNYNPGRRVILCHAIKKDFSSESCLSMKRHKAN